MIIGHNTANLLLSSRHHLRRGGGYLEQNQVLPVASPLWSTLQVGCDEEWRLNAYFFPSHMVSSLVEAGIRKVFLFILTAIILHKKSF